MTQQVYQTRITLQIYSQPRLIAMNNFMQIIYGSRIVAGAEIQRSDFIIKYNNAVIIYKQGIFIQLLYNFRNKRKSFVKIALHQVFIKPCTIDVNEGVNPEIIMHIGHRCFCKLFKLL